MGDGKCAPRELLERRKFLIRNEKQLPAQTKLAAIRVQKWLLWGETAELDRNTPMAMTLVLRETDDRWEGCVIHVNSSNLEAVDYENGILTVLFRNRAKYQYLGVPQVVFQNLLGVSSKGGYFARYIKGRYPYRRIG